MRLNENFIFGEQLFDAEMTWACSNENVNGDRNCFFASKQKWCGCCCCCHLVVDRIAINFIWILHFSYTQMPVCPTHDSRFFVNFAQSELNAIFFSQFWRKTFSVFDSSLTHSQTVFFFLTLFSVVLSVVVCWCLRFRTQCLLHTFICVGNFNRKCFALVLQNTRRRWILYLYTTHTTRRRPKEKTKKKKTEIMIMYYYVFLTFDIVEFQ